LEDKLCKKGSEDYRLAIHQLIMEMSKATGKGYDECQQYVWAFGTVIAKALAEGHKVEIASIGTLWLEEEYKWKTVNRDKPTAMRCVEMIFNASSKLEDLFLSIAERLVDRDLLFKVKNNQRFRRDIRTRGTNKFKLVLSVDGRVYEESTKET
jgi:nucleoid DNA-binding protein